VTIMTAMPTKSRRMRKRLRRCEWQLRRWQKLLHRRQNMAPARKTKNGHLGTVGSAMAEVCVPIGVSSLTSDAAP
jgi:hypothetical protein